MRGFLEFLSFVSFIGLIIGLIKPSVFKFTSRKNVLLWLGGAMVVFFTLSNITFTAAPSAETPEPQATVTMQMPTAQAMAVSSSSAINDASYVSYWNECLDNGIIADYETQFGNLAMDSLSNYPAAIQDAENMQKDIASAQTTCLPQLEKYKPLTSDIAQANTLTVSALTETALELKPILTDMQNSDNGATFNNDLTALTGMNDYGSAKKLIQAWQAAEKVKNSTSSPVADDATYVSYWNDCIEFNNMDDVATRLQNLSTDSAGHNYLAAINDVEDMQTDVLSAQGCLPQLASYEPLTPDVMQINTITVGFLSDMSASLNSVLIDMQGADYGSTLNNDMTGLLPEANSYNKTRQLIAAWQSENPQ